MKKLFFISLALGFCGCADLTVRQPTSMMEIPEVAGTNAAQSFDFGSMTSLSYTATLDASRRPPIFSPFTARSDSVYGRIRFPVSETKLEFSAGVYAYGLMAGIKYQFFGPSLTQAQQGDWSMAIVGQLSTSTSLKRSGDQNGYLGSGGNSWEGSIDSYQSAASLLFGWRAGKPVLLYAGPYVSSATIRAKIIQKISDDGKDAGGTYESGDVMQRTGPVLGVLWNVINSFSLQLEGAFLNTRFRNIDGRNDSLASLGFRFDFK